MEISNVFTGLGEHIAKVAQGQGVGDLNNVNCIIGKLEKHAGAENCHRIKDYLCHLGTIYDPENLVKGNEVYEFIGDRLLPVLHKYGWWIGVGEWKTLGLQIIVNDNKGCYYHSSFNHNGSVVNEPEPSESDFLIMHGGMCKPRMHVGMCKPRKTDKRHGVELEKKKSFECQKRLNDASALKLSLAEYAHTAWSGWMSYMLSKSQVAEDGSVIIPAELASHWFRQMTTKFEGLPVKEKMSDIDEAEKILNIIQDAVK